MSATSANPIPMPRGAGCRSRTFSHPPLTSPASRSPGTPPAHRMVPGARSPSLPYPLLFGECLSPRSRSHPQTGSCFHQAPLPPARPAHARVRSGPAARCPPAAGTSPLPAPGEPPLPAGPPDVSCTPHGGAQSPPHGPSAKHQCSDCHVVTMVKLADEYEPSSTWSFCDCHAVTMVRSI